MIMRLSALRQYYGPDDERATMLAVGTVRWRLNVGRITEKRIWTTAGEDVRTDPSVRKELRAYLASHKICERECEGPEFIVGCPHGEDNVPHALPDPGACAKCKYWRDLKRWLASISESTKDI